jgi:hypothetical protein
MIELSVGLLSIAVISAISYGIGYLLNETTHPIEVGIKTIILLTWVLLISYGIGWITVNVFQSVL